MRVYLGVYVVGYEGLGTRLGIPGVSIKCVFEAVPRYLVPLFYAAIGLIPLGVLRAL